MGNETILICDDERDIVAALRIYLESSGYQVLEAFNGAEALAVLDRKEQALHLAILDIMMPGLDGLQLTTRIRERSNMPIILLTAKGQDYDKVQGLNLGADDYIVKPFNPLELLARVRSQLRRYTRLGGMDGAGRESLLHIGNLQLDTEALTCRRDGDLISLTPIEFSILEFLMKNPGKVFSSLQIYETIWQRPPYGAEATVAVHIRHLREKIEINPSEPRYLTVVWGQGYRMENIAPLKILADANPAGEK